MTEKGKTNNARRSDALTDISVFSSTHGTDSEPHSTPGVAGNLHDCSAAVNSGCHPALAFWMVSQPRITEWALLRKKWAMLGIDREHPDPSMPTDMETDIPDEPDW